MYTKINVVEQQAACEAAMSVTPILLQRKHHLKV